MPPATSCNTHAGDFGEPTGGHGLAGARYGHPQAMLPMLELPEPLARLVATPARWLLAVSDDEDQVWEPFLREDSLID